MEYRNQTVLIDLECSVWDGSTTMKGAGVYVIYSGTDMFTKGSLVEIETWKGIYKILVLLGYTQPLL